MNTLKKRRYLRSSILILALCVIFLFSPIFASIRSYAVMLPYSYLHHRNSTLKKNNIRFHIPGGIKTKKRDWYPFIITFNDDEGLSRYLGDQVEFTILYSFGHFPLWKGNSTYYDPNSPFYSSFYGGYVVKPKDTTRKFGFLSNGEIDLEEISKVPEFDQKYLALASIGCSRDKSIFSEDVCSVDYNIDYIGYEDWIRIDSTIETSSPMHNVNEFQRGYIQYGKPKDKFQSNEDFPVIDLKGRVYVRYFEEFQATMVLYIMAPSWEIIQDCDRDILSKSSID